MSDLNSKVNTSDVLTLEDIQDTTDLTGKVASANAVKDISELKTYEVEIGIDKLLFKKVGKVVTLFARLENMSSNEVIISSTVPIDVAPKSNYSIINLHGYGAPFGNIGTAWIYPTGKIEIYKPSYTTQGYLYGTYIIG